QGVLRSREAPSCEAACGQGSEPDAEQYRAAANMSAAEYNGWAKSESRRIGRIVDWRRSVRNYVPTRSVGTRRMSAEIKPRAAGGAGRFRGLPGGARRRSSCRD